MFPSTNTGSEREQLKLSLSRIISLKHLSQSPRSADWVRNQVQRTLSCPLPVSNKDLTDKLSPFLPNGTWGYMRKEESLRVVLDWGLVCVSLKVPRSTLGITSKESLPLIRRRLTAFLVSYKRQVTRELNYLTLNFSEESGHDAGPSRSIVGEGTTEGAFQLRQERYELSQGSKILLPFNREIQYVLKYIVNYFIFIDVLIFQDSEGHAIIFIGDVEMVNQQ